MKFGIIPVNIGVQSTQDLLGLAQLAEKRGYESVWTFEHVIMPVDYQSKYPYSPTGKIGIDPATNFIDPLIALSLIAASTTRLRLGTGVNILSQSNPLYLAKQAASLDMLSNGRVMLGVGIGWLREEFDALGVPFEKRGARFDDYVMAMRKVWSGEIVEHQSEFLSWTGFISYPLPIQDPFPVVIGGSKGKIHERVAKYGNGWFAPTTSPKEVREHLQKIKKECDAIGRNFSEIEVSCMWSGKGGKEALQAFEEAGIHRLLVFLADAGRDPISALNDIADEVIA